MSVHEALAPYIAELELERSIEYQVEPGPIASMYNPDEGTHLLRYHGAVKPEDLEGFNPDRPFLASFIHELCHLHLAEKIDPSFAGFDTVGDEDKKARFSVIENALVDVWVNDLFHIHFPDLFSAHHDNYAAQAEGFIQNKNWVPLLPPAVPYTLARTEAEAIRHDLRQVDFKRLLQRAGFDSRTVGSKTGQSLVRAVDPAVLTQLQLKSIDKLWDFLRASKGEENPTTMKDVAAIRDFMIDVPEMSYDRNEALHMHEELANTFAMLGRMAVSARLIDEGLRPVWHLE